MSRTLEQTVEIKGEIGSSFLRTFREATGDMRDLRQEAKQVQRELNRLGNDFRSGKIHQSQYADETRKLTQELNHLERQQRMMDGVKSKMNSGWNTVKATASIAAIGAATAGTALAVKSLDVASDFESQMSKVASKTDATKGELKALTETALELGAKTSLSASESAVAMDELAAGGMNVNQIMSAMPGIIAGAEASGEDLSLVSSTVSSALSIWGLEAEKASKVSDILAKSANISAASVEDFSYAFKYAGKPAADLGYSIETTAAAISIMTDAGIDGSTAGTALRSSLLKLANPTKKQSKLMSQLGVSFEDSAGNAKELPQFIGELNESMKGMSNVEKVANLGSLVGTEAVSGFMTLMSAGESKLDSYTKKLENSAGSSAKASAIMMDNYAGAKEQMLGALESAQIAAASPSLDVLKQTFSGISNMIEDNLPAIEAAGQNVADVLEDVFAPFILYNEPLKPVITPEMDPTDAKAALADYQSQMEKFELFGKMDMGDKVDYMLDTTVKHVSDWVHGEGGEAMHELFGELAKIAAGAWAESFTTLATGAVSELAEGDLGTAIGMGALANAMTGGMLLTGGFKGGKYLVGKGKDFVEKGNKSVGAAVPNVAGKKTAKVQKAPNPVSTPKTTKAASMATKVLGKAALPITIATGAIGVATASNKAQATGNLAGSLAGGLGGAKLGAIIGTAIAPGIGTAIGGALGGLAGSIGGGWAGGKIGSAAGGAKAQPAVQQSVSQTAAPTNTTAVNTSITTLNTTIASLNTQATALATSVTTMNTTFTATATQMKSTFMPLNLTTQALVTNMSRLNIETAFAGMGMKSSFTAITTSTNLVLTGLNNIATNANAAATSISNISNIAAASSRVMSALNRLEQRINNVSVPSGASGGGRLAYE